MENKTIGKILKESRESTGFSLDEVAKKTKININILRHIEADRTESLPNKTYVRGFVKSYAKLVKMNENEAIDALNRTYGEAQALTKMESPKEETLV